MILLKMPVNDFSHNTSDMCYNVNSIYMSYVTGNHRTFDKTFNGTQLTSHYSYIGSLSQSETFIIWEITCVRSGYLELYNTTCVSATYLEIYKRQHVRSRYLNTYKIQQVCARYLEISFTTFLWGEYLGCHSMCALQYIKTITLKAEVYSLTSEFIKIKGHHDTLIHWLISAPSI